MNGLIIFLCVIIVLFLIGQIRLGCSVEYNAQGVGVWVHIGQIRLHVFPGKAKSTQKPKKPKKKKPEKPAKKEKPPKEPVPLLEKVGGALEYAQALLPIVLQALGHFGKKLSVDKLRLEMIFGADNPADAALRYGQACAVLGALWEPLVEAMEIRDGYARVVPDFEATDMTLYAYFKVTLKIGQILWFAVYFGIKSLSAFLHVYKNQKKSQEQRKAV